MKEIMTVTGRPQSSVYRYLSTLRQWGFVRESEGGRYSVGPRSIQLATSYRSHFGLVKVGRRVLEELSGDTGETAALIVPLNGRAVCIEVVESKQPLRYSFSLGAVLSMSRGASAKALLAFLESEDIDVVCQRELSDRDSTQALLAELEQIRSDGYAQSESELDEGAWAVGVPVFITEGTVEAAISVIAPVFRTPTMRRPEYISKTLSAARRLEILAGRIDAQ